MRKLDLIIESLNEAGIRDIKSANIEDVVKGRGNLNDYLHSVSKSTVLGQIVNYVKSLKSLKEVKLARDFFGYGGKGKDIEKLFNDSNSTEKDELYDYVSKVNKQYDSKYKSVLSKILKDFEELDRKNPNPFEALMDYGDGYYTEEVCDRFNITIESKDYAGYTNVNGKYCISIWLKGEADDDWVGSADEDGFTYELNAPPSCKKNLYVCVSKLYMCYAFEENLDKIKSGIDKFIKDNFK